MSQIVIDFDIMSTRPKNLIIADGSEWFYAQDLPAYILITLPGSKKPITFTFKKQALNRFNSHLLGLSCLANNCNDEVFIDLPDGIYTITVKSGFDKIEETKFYLKTDLFKQEFAKIMIKFGLEYNESNKQFLEEMMFVNGLVKVAESHAHEGNFTEAQRYFEEAKQKMKKRLFCN